MAKPAHGPIVSRPPLLVHQHLRIRDTSLDQRGCLGSNRVGIIAYISYKNNMDRQILVYLCIIPPLMADACIQRICVVRCYPGESLAVTDPPLRITIASRSDNHQG